MTHHMQDGPPRSGGDGLLDWIADAIGVDAFAHLYIFCMLLIGLIFPCTETRFCLWLAFLVSGCCSVAYGVAWGDERKKRKAVQP